MVGFCCISFLPTIGLLGCLYSFCREKGGRATRRWLLTLHHSIAHAHLCLNLHSHSPGNIVDSIGVDYSSPH